MLKDLVKSFRLKQWVKNGFLFAGLIFDGQLFHWDSFAITAIGFVIFNFITSGVYLINDVFDIAIDRQHPQKKYRPIASGRIKVQHAIRVAIFLLVISLIAVYLLSPIFFILCAIYLVSNLLYSKWLKHIPILDVMVIALGFVLRVAAGLSLISVKRFSPWLFVVTTLLALYLGFGKRRAEIVLFAENIKSGRSVLDGYTLPFLDQLITIVSSATIVAYSLYTFSALSNPGGYSMMLTIPFVMYGVFRYLYLVQVKQSGGAPEEILFQDIPLQITVILYAVCVFVLFYLI
jgi:4-hydroxybenzoate polyprenyltransferase